MYNGTLLAGIVKVQRANSILFIMVFFAIIVLVIYSPAIYSHISALFYEKKFKRLLKEIEDEGFYEKNRIVITKPLGVGTEPAGKISFAEAMENQEFAMKSIMKLLNG